MNELIFTGKMERADGLDFYLEALAGEERVLVFVPAPLADRMGIDGVKSRARSIYKLQGATGGRIDLSEDGQRGLPID